MNDLADKFGDDLVIIGIPTNQFGHQTNEQDFEFLNCLKYVRPGDGYEPKFIITTKVAANGSDAHPVFQFLRAEKPIPDDDFGGQGADFITNDVKPMTLLYSPISRSDLAWNFEKFLINKDGEVVGRYSPKFETKDLAPLIEKLL